MANNHVDRCARVFILLALMWAPLGGYVFAGDVFKCKDKSGKVYYTDRGCNYSNQQVDHSYTPPEPEYKKLARLRREEIERQQREIHREYEALARANDPGIYVYSRKESPTLKYKKRHLDHEDPLPTVNSIPNNPAMDDFVTRTQAKRDYERMNSIPGYIGHTPIDPQARSVYENQMRKQQLIDPKNW